MHPRLVLFSPDGTLRAGWRLLAYAVLTFVCGRVLFAIARQIPAMHGRFPGIPNGAFTPGTALIREVVFFLVVLIPAVVMAHVEKRTLGAYGLPVGASSGRMFALGALWGFAAISLTIAVIALLHGYEITSLALSRLEIVRYGLLWLAMFMCTGLAEEFTFRGYTQFTLATGIGFWPAALVLSAAFGALHLDNTGEGLVGALEVFFIAIFFCFTLRRTGSLWFAIGMHALFDWGESFLYSVPDSGLTATGHLFNIGLHGPRWLTGGTVGPEGSVASFLVIALSFAAFNWLVPAAPAPRAEARASSA